MMKKIFHVADMHCPNCAMCIEGIEDDLPGIRAISASYQKGQVAVEYDETAVSEQEILLAVARLGYHLEPA